jgi:hypothetical protein
MGYPCGIGERRSAVKKMLAGLAAFAVTLGGVGATMAQTPSPPGQRATKPDETKTATQTAVGTIKATLPDSIVVVGKVKGQDVEWTFGVDTRTKVRKASKDVTATELRPGDPVQVRYLEQDGKTIAQHIAVTTPVKPKTEKAPPQKK